METSPYAAPVATVDDGHGDAKGDLQSRKAIRGKRRGPLLPDVVVNVLWPAPLIPGVVMAGGVSAAIKSAGPMLALVWSPAMRVINGGSVQRDGQTSAKRMLDIATVHRSGDHMGLAHPDLLRLLPISQLSGLPWVGKFAGRVEGLLIFGTQRRFRHDLIADTIVINI